MEKAYSSLSSDAAMKLLLISDTRDFNTFAQAVLCPHYFHGADCCSALGSWRMGW